MKWKKKDHLVEEKGQANISFLWHKQIQDLKILDLNSCGSLFITLSGWSSRNQSQYIKHHGLWQRPALAIDDVVSSFHPKAWSYLCLNVTSVFSHTFDIRLRMMVLNILVLSQEPESILPLIDVPVNEHFWSIYVFSIASLRVLNPKLF